MKHSENWPYFYRLLAITTGVIVINYIAFYLDDLLITLGYADRGDSFIVVLEALAAPVTAYVEVVERNFFIQVPVLVVVVNYLIELTYFLVFVGAAMWIVEKLNRFTKKSTKK